MNKYVKAFTEIAFFFNANRPYLLQNLEKQVSEQKIKSTHIPLTGWGHWGVHLVIKCVRTKGHPRVGLS